MLDNRYILLPPEILTAIFKKLPKEALVACLSVCKPWFHPAALIHYSRFYIDDSKEGKRGVQKLTHYIKNTPDLSIGYKIKSIRIDGQQQRRGRIMSSGTTAIPSSKQELQTLLRLCPNLQEMAFSINSVYWKHVYEMDYSIFDEIQLARVYTVGNQQCYEEEYFYKAAHQFRSSICQLEIHCSCDASIHDSFGSLYSYLADFPLLQNLTIKSGSQRHMIYFQQLLNVCKHLKKLNFQLDHPFFEHDHDQQLWSEYPSMQEIDIYLPTFGVDQLQYIIHRLPNLKKFGLRINQNDNLQKKLWIADQVRNFESAVQFFKHEFIRFIANLDSWHLYFNIHGRSYIEDLVESFYVPSLQANKETSIDAVFEVQHGRTEQTQIVLTKEKETQRHVFNYTFVRELSPPELLLDERQMESTQHLPYISHLHSYGQHLRHLHITITAQAKHNDAADINFVLRQCPNLQELGIAVELSPIVYFSHDDSLIHRQHPPTCNPYTTAFNSKLSTLTLKGMTISSDLLHTIATQHPNLTHLAFINCLSEPSMPETATDSNLSFFTYNLSNLHLKSLVFDIFTHRCGKKFSGPMVCIVVERQDTSCSYYLTKQQNDPFCGELFEDITSLRYQELGADSGLALTVVKFRVKLVDELVLQAGRNQSFTKKIEFTKNGNENM